MAIFGFGRKKEKDQSSLAVDETRGEELVSVKDFDQLPTLAQLAFAARCIRRIETRAELVGPAKDKALGVVDKAAHAIAGYAETRDVSHVLVIVETIGDIAVSQRELPAVESSMAPRLALLAAQYFTTYALESVNYIDAPKDRPDPRHPIGVLNAVLRNLFGGEQRSVVRRAVQGDLELLRTESSQNRWTNSTPTPEDFFPLRASFDTHDPVQQRSIIEIAPHVEAELLAFFRRHPDELRKVQPRRFEEIIAEIFSKFGFIVELTAQTRDGGRDIVAIKNSPVNIKLLIECKRFVPPNKVGIGVVQRLHGVTISEGASKGIIATTSYFSEPAKNHIEKHPFILEGRDFDGVVEWLRLYDMFKMATMIDVALPRSPKDDPEIISSP